MGERESGERVGRKSREKESGERVGRKDGGERVGEEGCLNLLLCLALLW